MFRSAPILTPFATGLLAVDYDGREVFRSAPILTPFATGVKPPHWTISSDPLQFSRPLRRHSSYMHSSMSLLFRSAPILTPFATMRRA